MTQRRGDLHVIWIAPKKWIIKERGRLKFLEERPSQAQAWQRALALARKANVDCYLHRVDGTVYRIWRPAPK